jgi:hypothetical protein
MLRRRLRPWGDLAWLLGKLPSRTWSVLMCLATEDRCLSAWETVHKNGGIARGQFVEIATPQWRFTELAETQKQQIRERRATIAVPSTPDVTLDLFSDTADVVSCADDFASAAGPDVILDISCFPKRFFFPFVHRLLTSAVRNLVVTYAVPEAYYEGTLAEDHKPLAHLPLFGIQEFPEPRAEVVIISVGFVPLGVNEIIQPGGQRPEIKLLFPFPPGPPHFQRNWRFLLDLERNVPGVSESPIRVEAYNVPDTFDRISEITGAGGRRTALAPYGPKPISLAMCLYARHTNTPVFYTQPMFYHPKYSMGIARRNGEPVIFAYLVRLNGKDLYTL